MINQSKVSNICLHVIKVGIFIILFLPLFVNHNFLYPFVFPRTIFFRLIIEICLAIYLVLIVINSYYRPRWSTMLGLLSTFIGIMTVSSLLGVNWYRSFWSSIERSEGIITWLHLLTFFIILIGIFKAKEDWLQLFKIVIVAGWIQGIYALGQYLNLFFALSTTGERISGSLGNPSFLATYFIFIIFIAAYLYTQTTSSKTKIYYGLFILLNTFLLWETQTRGAILAFLLGIAFLGYIKFWRGGKFKSKIVLVSILLVIIITTMLSALNFHNIWLQTGPLRPIRRLLSISITEASTQNRIIIWGVGWQAFKERSWLGWGWENFNAPFNKYFDPTITRDIGSHPWYDRAHNVVIETAVSTGIFGLLSYLSIIGWAIILLWRKQKSNQLSSTVSLLLTVLLLIYFLQNLFVFDTLNSYTLFFLILAFIQFQQSNQKTIKLTIKEKQIKTKLVLVPILLIIIIPLAYFLNIRPVLANYHIIQAVVKHKTDPVEMLNSFQKAFGYTSVNQQELYFILIQHTRDQINLRGITDETIPLIKFAIEGAKKNIQASPHSVQNYLLLSELYLATTQLNPQHLHLAETIALEALKKAPKRYQIHTMLGRIKISQNQFAESINYLQQAIELNNQFAETHWNLAIAYILSWQPELAQQSLDKSFELGLDIYQQKNVNLLLLAYKDSKNINATINFLKSLIEHSPDNQYYQESLKLLEKIQKQIQK